MKTKLLLLSLAAGAALNVSAQTSANDPFIWLEDAHGARAMAWVEAENTKTGAALENNALFDTLFKEARIIAEAKDRIPQPSVIDGKIFNFWQDADHPHGIWRQTTQTDFQSKDPAWRTVLDLDALSKTEKANWF